MRTVGLDVIIQDTEASSFFSKIRERVFEGAFISVALIAMAGWVYFITVLVVRLAEWFLG